MLTLGEGLGQKMTKVRHALNMLKDKYAVPTLSAVNDSLSVAGSVNSIIHIIHNMF